MPCEPCVHAEGTFLSAIEKLDHLATLGVTHVEFMPVIEFSGNHNWGCDGVDLFAPGVEMFSGWNQLRIGKRRVTS